MRRELLWSIGLHLAVIVGGALLAPLGNFGDGYSRPIEIISVGLVASTPSAPGPSVPMPQVEAPEPAMNDAVAIKPETDLTKEEIAPEEEPVPEEPTPEETKQEEPENKPEDQPEDTKKTDRSQQASADTAQQLAQAGTGEGTIGNITEGAGSGGDVWGVETNAAVNPYHRRGFIAIRNNWRNPATSPRPLKCVVRFRVDRSGAISDVVLEKPSGNTLFDRQAVRAVEMTGSWEAFPKFWEEDEQIIHLEFEYRP